jgi:hypothetical protein
VIFGERRIPRFAVQPWAKTADYDALAGDILRKTKELYDTNKLLPPVTLP